MTLALTIVRHGDTFAPGEAPRRIGAKTDLPLVASGEAQARALGRLFARETFDRVLVSPLRRTQHTAELILAESNAPPSVETCSWLAEIDHGPDEDQAEDRVLARLGAAALARWNEALVAPAGWIVDAPGRLAAWRGVLATATGHMLIITSAGAARFVLKADPALAHQARSLASLKLRTGAWGKIVVADGRSRIAAWDRRPDETYDG
ncbi:histidine phosphatase family protein [Sphingomonas sp. PB4P5]|uniref:histidine phosphatase family protein n=1 Tax=Parasphingomonas puruogangriensis TaxID=3096155 RepID=UPI002FC68239